MGEGTTRVDAADPDELEREVEEIREELGRGAQRPGAGALRAGRRRRDAGGGPPVSLGRQGRRALVA
jgi:hypothetical protein